LFQWIDADSRLHKYSRILWIDLILILILSFTSMARRHREDAGRRRAGRGNVDAGTDKLPAPASS
jgi:hypothetical protein